jgi:integral membrane protein (TIGR00529 family)
MGLEVELRKSGALKGVVATMRTLFSSNRVTLAVMPAFLGLLPSLGGARFSCPIVEEASRGILISPEEKSAVNLWFRHIFEFSNPLVPGMILACAITGVSLGTLITHIGWLTILSFVLGWIILIRPLKIADKNLACGTVGDRIPIDWLSLFLALGPIFAVFVLVVAFHSSAALATGVVVVAFIPILYLVKRPVRILDIFTESLDKKLFLNVSLILLFIQILEVTGTLSKITDALMAANLSAPILFASLAFIFGVLTGLSQGYIAMVLPLVAAMTPGNVVMIGIVMAFGVAGQMITPTHVCILVTVEYFKSHLWKTIAKNGIIAAVMLLIFSLWTYFRYFS